MSATLLQRAERQVPSTAVLPARYALDVAALQADVVVPQPGDKVGLARDVPVEVRPGLRRLCRVDDRFGLLDLLVERRVVHLGGVDVPARDDVLPVEQWIEVALRREEVRTPPEVRADRDVRLRN